MVRTAAKEAMVSSHLLRKTSKYSNIPEGKSGFSSIHHCDWEQGGEVDHEESWELVQGASSTITLFLAHQSPNLQAESW